jgi:hypothetical protein
MNDPKMKRAYRKTQCTQTIGDMDLFGVSDPFDNEIPHVEIKITTFDGVSSTYFTREQLIELKVACDEQIHAIDNLTETINNIKGEI